MTLDGRVLDPPGSWSRIRWTRARRFWQALPRGALPALLLLFTMVVLGAVVLVGILVVALPVVALLGVAGLLLRPRRAPLARPR